MARLIDADRALEIGRDQKSTYDCFVVNCRACGASMFPKDTERAARIAWNRRAQDGNKQ